MAHCCFSHGCELEVQYVCQCLSSITYCCEFHLQAHLKLPNRAHIFDSVLAEPSEFTKDVILKFLTEEKLKKEKLKKIILASFTRNLDNTENNIKSRLRDLNSELKEINTIIKKISQISENIPLRHHNNIREAIQQNSSEEYADIRLFFQLCQLRHKKSKILSIANNSPEIEQDFRKTCELFKNHASNSQLSQVYQEYINEYQNIAYTYLIDEGSFLYSYNTEKEIEKYFLVPEVSKYKNSLTQLPNGELFIIGCKESSQIAFILDRNHQIRNLSLGAPEECFNAIYFNRSVYCFGNRFNRWNSRKFDLEKNRWIELTPIQKPINYYFNSVIFNRNILISIDFKSDILLYSTDIDSFSEIPYSFAVTQKILISAEKRLYLIENNGWIYESRDEYNWKRISISIIEGYPEQVYCSYNKGGIYISILNKDYRNYFKFDLNQKALIEIAFYSDDLSLKKSENKLEAIDCYDQTFRLNPNHAAIYIDKGYSLYYIGKNFDELEKVNEFIESVSEDFEDYAVYLNKKGEILCNLGRYIEAIECYNGSIKNGLDNSNAYRNKGNALLELGKNKKALKCFNKAIKLEPGYPYYYFDKGKALMNLEKYIEAVKCFSHVIKLRPWDDELYNKKGEALYNLDRNAEAIECYNKAIKIDCDEPMYYYNRGNALNKLGRQEEALQDFNKAEDLNKISE